IYVTTVFGPLSLSLLVALPIYMTGALVGDYLYIAGGNSSPTDAPRNDFLALNLAADSKSWTVLESWPGSARMQAVSASLQNKFFLFSGIDIREGDSTKERVILTDAYVFTPGTNPAEGSWRRLADMPR